MIDQVGPPGSTRTETGLVDLRPIKQEAAKSFEPGHPYREAMMAEPDFIPLAEWLPKAEVYVRLLLAGRARR